MCVFCLGVLGDTQSDDDALGPLQTTHLINDYIHHTSPTPCSPIYLSSDDLTRSVSRRSNECIWGHVGYTLKHCSLPRGLCFKHFINLYPVWCCIQGCMQHPRGIDHKSDGWSVAFLLTSPCLLIKPVPIVTGLFQFQGKTTCLFSLHWTSLGRAVGSSLKTGGPLNIHISSWPAGMLRDFSQAFRGIFLACVLRLTYQYN